MPTGTAATVARSYHQSQVHYLKKEVNYTDGASAVVNVGIVPAGAIIIRAAIVVLTAFNAGTNNNIRVGVSGSDNGIMADVAATSAGVKINTTIATAAAATINPSADTTIIATLGLTGTAASAGRAVIVVEYTNL